VLRLFVFSALCAFMSLAIAKPTLQSVNLAGGNLFHNAIKEEPHQIGGWRGALVFADERLHWGNLDIFFDVSVGHWRSRHGQPTVAGAAHVPRSITTFTVAPVFRYIFSHNQTVSPYFIGSVGPTLLSDTKFAGRDFSMLYTFQDRAGFGVAFGKDLRNTIDIQILHYSNANLGKKNPGMTIPLILSLGVAVA